MKANIKLSLSRLNPVKLLALLYNVIAKLKENAALFAKPPVTVDDMELQATALQEAIELATNGSLSAKATRNNLALDAGNTLTTTADYVRMVCGGDAAKLTRSGFELVKTRTPVGMVGTPLIRIARMTGIQGEVELGWSKQHGAGSYQLWRTDQDPATAVVAWTLVLSTTRTRAKLTGLESYKPFWFCVNGLGAEGAGPKSDPVIARAA